MNIQIIYNQNHMYHNPPFEIYNGEYEPYAEKAERVTSILQTLQNNGFNNIQSPMEFSLEYIFNVHQKAYVEFIRAQSLRLHGTDILYPSYFIMDTYTPITAHTFASAKSGVDATLTGAHSIIAGERNIYVLSRPPGHHAGYNSMGGYCYFNNSAIAANFLSQYGKVAILDIDFHHGNGTQSIFYNRPDVLFVSIHADPHKKFPYSSGFPDEQGTGKGLGYNINYPLPLGTTDNQYLQTLNRTLENIQNYNPAFLIVSAGFDTYRYDPIGGFPLTIPFYKTIGTAISSLRIPTLIIQEGGYHIGNLGKMVYAFLQGIIDE